MDDRHALLVALPVALLLDFVFQQCIRPRGRRRLRRLLQLGPQAGSGWRPAYQASKGIMHIRSVNGIRTVQDRVSSRITSHASIPASS